MSKTASLIPLIASECAKRIFSLLEKVRPEDAKGEMLNYLVERADAAIIEESRIGKRMEHTIIAPFPPWHWRSCAPLATFAQGRDEKRCRSEFFAEALSDGGAKLLHACFCVEPKPKFFKTDTFSEMQCAGRLSEPSESELAAFLRQWPGAGILLEGPLAALVARPVSETAQQA